MTFGDMRPYMEAASLKLILFTVPAYEVWIILFKGNGFSLQEKDPINIDSGFHSNQMTLTLI